MSGFAFLIHDDRVEETTPKAALGQNCAFAWIHLDWSHERAVRWLEESAGLEPFVSRALVATETRPRTEIAGGGALINLRGRSTSEMRLSDPLASLRMWANEGRVISTARLPLVALAPVRHAVEAGHVRDPGDLIAQLASCITADLDPEVGDLGDRLDDCEEQIDGPRIVETRRKVALVRAEAIGYRRFVAPQRGALERLAEASVEWLDEADRRHLRDAADRAARMAEELESIRERAALIHETLTDMRAEVIDTRSLLIAIVAMIFLPLTFITGLLGMNVEGIPYAREPWAFDAVVGLCIVLAVAIAGYFLIKRWTRR